MSDLLGSKCACGYDNSCRSAYDPCGGCGFHSERNPNDIPRPDRDKMALDIFCALVSNPRVDSENDNPAMAKIAIEMTDDLIRQLSKGYKL